MVPQEVTGSMYGAGNFRPSPYEVADQEEGRTNLMARQYVKQSLGIRVIRSVVEGKCGLLAVETGDKGTTEDQVPGRVAYLLVALLQEPDLRVRCHVGQSICTVGMHDGLESTREDIHVHPDGPVPNVVLVELDTFSVGSIVTARYLPQTGKAGCDPRV